LDTFITLSAIKVITLSVSYYTIVITFIALSVGVTLSVIIS